MTVTEHDTGPVYGRVVTRVKRPSRAATERILSVLVEDAHVEIGPTGRGVSVPREVKEFLTRALLAIDEGETVTLVIGAPTEPEEISSQAAADMLNVSRPHVVKLARDGVLPHRMVGNRHRFVRCDILAYKSLQDSRRAQILDQMAEQGGGYTSADF